MSSLAFADKAALWAGDSRIHHKPEWSIPLIFIPVHNDEHYFISTVARVHKNNRHRF